MVVIIICGLPGTGKSTIVSNLVNEFENASVLSTDSIRKVVFSHFYGRQLQKKVYSEENIQIVYNVISILLDHIPQNNRLVIIDGTFHQKFRREQLIKTLDKEPYHFVILEASQHAIINRLGGRSVDSESDARLAEYGKLKSQADYPRKGMENYSYCSTDLPLQESLNQIKLIIDKISQLSS